jgi:hypothetical protein
VQEITKQLELQLNILNVKLNFLAWQFLNAYMSVVLFTKNASTMKPVWSEIVEIVE